MYHLTRLQLLIHFVTFVETVEIMIKNKPDINQEGVYSQSEAARALDIDRHTVARYVRRGELESARRGTRNVIKGTAILQLWEGKGNGKE